ncbi:MAG: hypothetical protein K0S38_389 [Candidatus Paceibacter sp.]|jgi:hypothetical protein|nr:hypothetical protein [Candidatus Paceibacter sp.]
MATQPVEVFGKVIGYGVVVNPEFPEERKIFFTTREELQDLNRRQTAGEFKGMWYFTRIQGPDGIVEQDGVDQKIPPPGLKMQRHVCVDCNTIDWIPVGDEDGRVANGAYLCYNCQTARDQERQYNEVTDIEYFDREY